MRIRPAAKVAAVLLSSVVICWAVLFHALGWTALVRESGGSCRGSDCPEGLPAVLILAFVFSLGGLALMGKAREAAGLGRGATAAVVVAGVLAGLLPGLYGYQWIRGEKVETASPLKAADRLEIAWRAPQDRSGAVKGLRGWSAGDTVVRVRTDGLSGYAVKDGKERWNVTAPVRESVCAQSAHPSKGIGLVAYGRHNKPCTTLTAVRLDDGATLWKQTLKGEGIGKGIALGGATAVTLEDRAVRGRSAEAGGERWKRPVPERCQTLAMGATAARTLVVEECLPAKTDGIVTARLLALDTRTGKEEWASKLPVESAGIAYVYSVEPAVIGFQETDERGVRAVLAFGERGEARAAVPFSGRSGDLDIRRSESDLKAEGPFVAGDTLVAAVQKPGDIVPQYVAGFSIADGRELWRTGDLGNIGALALRDDGRVAVLTAEWPRSDIVVLDPGAGGAVTKETTLGKEAPVSIDADMLAVRDSYVVVNRYTDGEPPVFALR
ncbi:PQQ-binding-like beta-propeller repeat protein [Streptomyces sp. ISL-99]|uniref:outer membrane protein assembly factor BamB family protein n=1 Tax=Streptomyces sp. ISL-99 TaxID=2819193 RepID=UPI001BE8EED9|nr:PQQ-binding-like beta-propeller repeat protein [Streptomyces sp. ISL-99]MBT2525554.1 PQQ-binding-like beta-propeller repeat protein [Streptomyces sp. ISL-99]